MKCRICNTIFENRVLCGYHIFWDHSRVWDYIFNRLEKPTELSLDRLVSEVEKMDTRTMILLDLT